MKFSPDGEKIAVWKGSYADFGIPKTLTIVDRKTGDRIDISAEAEVSGHLSWSPDGKTLAYSTLPKGWGGEAILWLIDADGSNRRRLTQTTDRKSYEFLNWLPDGQAILYVLSPTSGTDYIQGAVFQIIGLEAKKPHTLFTYGQRAQLIGDNMVLFWREFYETNNPRISEAGHWVTTLSYNQ